MTEIAQYEIGPVSKLKVAELKQSLTQSHIPFQEHNDERQHVLVIGLEGEYALRTEVGSKGKPKAAFILMRYENPALKGILLDWAKHCRARIAEEFYTWHFLLSPALLKSVSKTWHLELKGLPLTPFRVGANVLVLMSSTDLSEAIRAQLVGVCGRAMETEEYLRCADWGCHGDEPLNMNVFYWKDDAGIDFYVVTGSAPASTILSLWRVPPGAAVEVSMRGFAQPGASPNGGPSSSLANSVGAGGPPSVS